MATQKSPFVIIDTAARLVTIFPAAQVSPIGGFYFARDEGTDGRLYSAADHDGTCLRASPGSNGSELEDFGDKYHTDTPDDARSSHFFWSSAHCGWRRHACHRECCCRSGGSW